MGKSLKEQVLTTLKNSNRYKTLPSKYQEILYKELSNIYKENTLKSNYPNIYDNYYQEFFHSISLGPIEEAYNKFVNPVLELLERKDTVNILDIGSGMFVNSACLAYELMNMDIKVNIISVDKKVPNFVVLNHKTDDLRALFYKNNFLLKDKYLNWRLLTKDARSICCHSFDVVLHDGFSPYKNPSLWSLDFLNIIFKSLKPMGIWVSYTSNKSVEASLRFLGFRVDFMPSFGRKSPSMRALKISSKSIISKNPYAIPMRDKSLKEPEANIITDYFLRVYTLRYVYSL